MIYEKIYELCKYRNLGSVLKNTEEPTPRAEYLMELLEEEGISYELDKFYHNAIPCYNIILRGDSGRMLVAHHDIVNPQTDNANDNSASVINAIALKKMLPHIHVVLLDGEEFGGFGSQRVSEQILAGEFGNIDWVLNLELSGKGGRKFFMGNYPGPLQDRIKSLLNPPITFTPFNDSVIFRKNGIDSCVINPLPTTDKLYEGAVMFEGQALDLSMLFHCHSPKDTIDTIDTKDMQEFVEEVVFKILK